MKQGCSHVGHFPVDHYPALNSPWRGLATQSVLPFLPVRGWSIRFAVMFAAVALFLEWPAWADVVPYFVSAPEDSVTQTIQDLIADVSSAQLFLVAGCVIAAMEAVFFVGLLRARKRHGDK